MHKWAEVISSIMTKVKMAKISICKCENILLFDIENLASLIKTNLQMCNLWTGQSLKYTSVKQFWLNLPYSNGKTFSRPHCKPKPSKAYRELLVSQFSQEKTFFYYREPCSYCRDPVFITGISLQNPVLPCTRLQWGEKQNWGCFREW